MINVIYADFLHKGSNLLDYQRTLIVVRHHDVIADVGLFTTEIFFQIAVLEKLSTCRRGAL